MALFDELAQKYKVAKDAILSNPIAKGAQNYYNATQAINPLTALTNSAVRQKVYQKMDQVAQSPQLATVKQKLNQPINASPQVLNAYQKASQLSKTVSRPFELYGSQQVGVPALKAVQEDRKGNTIPSLLSATQAGFGLTPKGIVTNALTGTSTSIAQASKNKDLANLPSNLIKNVTKPTSFATEGLGVQNPIIAMGIDLVSNGGDPRQVASMVKNKKVGAIASNLFGREKELRLNAEELVQAQKVLRNKTKFSPQEFEDAKNAIYNLAERHLTAELRDKLVGSPAKLAKAIEQELNKPKPQVYPTQWTKSSLVMGLDEATPPKGVGGENVKKMRSFPERVTVSPDVPQVVKEATAKSPSSFYKPITNKETISKAQKLIAKDEAAAITFARTDGGVDGNATALVLLEKYLKEGKFEQANQVINEFSPRLTESGQAIQIMSKFGKLTPAGAVRYTKKLADEAKVPLTEDRIRRIADKANELKGMADGSQDKINKTAELIKEMKDVVPPSLGQKISTIQTMAQLINPTTAIRNIGGNAIFAGLENVSDTLGAGIDKGLSLLTGKRSKVLPDLGAQAKGFKTGLKAGVSDAIKGIDTSNNVGTQFDLPSTMTFRNGILNKLEKTMNIELKATDRAAYQAAFDGSISNQMRAAKAVQPTEEMMKVAHADALYKTFQDNSKLAQVFGGLKKTLNKAGTSDGSFGAGDLILKYPKTPANILSRGLDYSPAGFFKGMYEAVRPFFNKGEPFNQKQFVEAMSRATVGTGLIAIGIKLAKDGIITGKPEKDKDIAATQKAAGGGPFKINLSALQRYFLSGFQPQKEQQGDTLATYDWAQPTAIPLTMGVNFALGGKGQDAVTNFLDSTDSAIEGLTQQPLVKGVTQFATDLNQKGLGSAVGNAVLSTPSSFTPSIVSKVAQTIDPMARETYDPNVGQQAVNQVVNKIPVLRSKLPEKVDVLGRPVQYGSDNLIKRIIQNFVSPAIITKTDLPQSAQEVLDLFDRTGDVEQAPQIAAKNIKINGQKVNLTPQQLTQYQKYIGTRANDLITKLANDPKYQKLDDQTKVNLISSYLSDINSAAKIQLFGNKPESISANVEAITKGKLPTTFNVKRTNGKIKITRLKKVRVPKPRKIKVKTIKSRMPKSRKIKVRKIKV